jgi:hypothetical protein
LFHDSAFKCAMRERDYIAPSHPVTMEAVATWPTSRGLWNNLIATRARLLRL